MWCVWLNMLNIYCVCFMNILIILIYCTLRIYFTILELKNTVPVSLTEGLNLNKSEKYLLIAKRSCCVFDRVTQRHLYITF